MKAKNLKFVVAALAAGALAFAAVTPAYSADKTLSIKLISKGFTHQFWQAVKAGAETQAAAMNAKITFEGPAAETEIDKQLEMLDAAIAVKPDAIGYAALGVEQSLSHLKKAKEAGIPVYMFDTGAGGSNANNAATLLGPNSDIALGLAATDSKGAGAMAAKTMNKLLKGKGTVLVVGHSQTNQTGIDRRDGFVNQIKKYKGIKLLKVQYVEGGDQTKTAELVQTALIANKNITGIFATNEGTAIGAGKALIALKKKKGSVKLIGFDSGAAQKAAITSGVQSGAITQDPIGIGKKVVEALVNYVRSNKVPAPFINTGFHYYDAKNINNADIAAVLYD